MKRIIDRWAFSCAFVLILLGQPLFAQTVGDIPVSTVQTSSAIWPVGNLIDGNTQTVWSSNVRSGSNNTEWIAYWFNGFYRVNYIKLRPRFYGVALGFPIQFTVYWSDGSAWHQIFTKANYPTPRHDDWIVLPFPSAVQANGIHIVVTVLGKDNVNNYVFQLAEAGAGYDAGFERLRFNGTDPNTAFPMHNEIHNAGSGDFDQTKLVHWNFDYRRPLIGGKNIYAPNIVKNYGTWNIYFGGWDQPFDQNDRIYIVTTADNFQTFSPHYLQIDRGSYTHVNNESVVKVSDTDWRMIYTAAPTADGAVNKPMAAYSANGANWNPAVASPSFLLSMSGYPDWSNANVNGANVLYYEAGKYYLYFVNFNNWAGVPYAVSDDGRSFSYKGLISTDPLIINDMKSFQTSAAKRYMAVYHKNGPALYYSVSQNPEQFPPAQQLLTHWYDRDRHITSVGLVTDGRRLYGLLYGASSVDALNDNSIFAAWLQKKVIFENNYVRWGESEEARGPNDLLMYMSTGVETGRYKIYDTDGQTLLFTSPLMTIQTGDNWTYSPQ